MTSGLRAVIDMPDIDDLAEAIQLALAPVFLLTGIAGLLNVMVLRIARIVDRGRALAEEQVTLLERTMLEPRRRLTSVAITATTVAALLVCMVIAGLFVEVMLNTPLKWVISASFAGAMLALMVGLMLGYTGLPGYIASKWGVRGLTKAAALELARDKIRVNSVHPGIIKTPLSMSGPAPAANVNPMRRAGEPSEVGNLVVFLASDESSFSTGSEFIIDGGQTAGAVMWGFDEERAAA
jgi:NAD(P)-dependent dehydrogenase (short-subunit alcohol dehydrogenase family)